MSPERWQQLKALFTAVVARPPGERAAFLASASAGDDGLRRKNPEWSLVILL